MQIQTPEWVKNAVFYQIFPDRFSRSLRIHHPRGFMLKPWGTPPEEQGFQGGDLYGIIDKFDYLKSLGINALYLNPIFSSASNHRYHTYDYMQVDPLLGGNSALRELLDTAHSEGIRVVLDGVFNHASRGFWAFHHILENGRNSPYLDWFEINGWPLRPYSSSHEKPSNYSAWANLPALPAFNTDNPGVREYLFDVARYWVDFGIDGWRLDVPGDIDDDSFWQEFRRVVKGANPDAYICGEIWHEATRWLQGDQFDAVMNYIFARNALAFFGGKTIRKDWLHAHVRLDPIDAVEFSKRIDEMHDLYPWEINQVQLNLLDSHDMPRALYLMGGDKSALRLCALFQMTMPGAPCIYYGDEIGLSSPGDPYCREAFPWNNEPEWDWELLSYYRDATRLRHDYPVLRTGTYRAILARGGVFGFLRELEDQEAIVLFNTGTDAVGIHIPANQIYHSDFSRVWPKDLSVITSEHNRLNVHLPAREAVVLLSK